MFHVEHSECIQYYSVKYTLCYCTCSSTCRCLFCTSIRIYVWLYNILSPEGFTWNIAGAPVLRPRITPVAAFASTPVRSPVRLCLRIGLRTRLFFPVFHPPIIPLPFCPSFPPGWCRHPSGWAFVKKKSSRSALYNIYRVFGCKDSLLSPVQRLLKNYKRWAKCLEVSENRCTFAPKIFIV